jgi:hypothetical protein
VIRHPVAFLAICSIGMGTWVDSWPGKQIYYNNQKSFNKLRVQQLNELLAVPFLLIALRFEK